MESIAEAEKEICRKSSERSRSVNEEGTAKRNNRMLCLFSLIFRFFFLTFARPSRWLADCFCGVWWVFFGVWLLRCGGACGCSCRCSPLMPTVGCGSQVKVSETICYVHVSGTIDKVAVYVYAVCFLFLFYFVIFNTST